MTQKERFIDLIRHGEPRGGVRFRGRLDDPLSELGWRQMEEAVDGDAPWSRIIASPLARCADFAKKLADERALPLSFDERLRELGFGDWEGKRVEEIMEDDPEALRRFWEDPEKGAPPGGESLLLFRDRVLAGWAAIVAVADDPHPLVVCHGGVIRVILAGILSMPLGALFTLEVPYACRSRVKIIEDDEGRRYQVLSAHGNAAR